MDKTDINNSILIERFHSVFSYDDVQEIMSILRNNARNKIMQDSTEEDIQGVILEMRAISLLGSLFTEWRNDSIDSISEAEFEGEK